MAGDPVSWLLIEPGWTVVAAGGSEVGRVEQVVGDPDNDIFSGLAVSSGLLTGLVGKPRFVPAERISSITEGRIELDAPNDELERFDAFEPAPAPEQVRP